MTGVFSSQPEGLSLLLSVQTEHLQEQPDFQHWNLPTDKANGSNGT